MSVIVFKTEDGMSNAMKVLKAGPVYKSASGLSISFIGAPARGGKTVEIKSKGPVIKLNKEN